MDDMYFKKYAFSISVVISGPHIDFSNVKTQEQIETITKALESSKYIDQNLTESWLRDFLDYIKRNEVCMHCTTSNSGGMGTQNPGFGYLQYNGEMGRRQVEQGFSSFFAKFFYPI